MIADDWRSRREQAEPANTVTNRWAKKRRLVMGLIAGSLFASATLVCSATATAAPKCTDQINYAGDPRSNAEINGIGYNTGLCPTPTTGVSAAVANAVSGAVLGTPCSNFERYIFGQNANGQWLACVSGGTSTGNWVASVPVVGTFPIGSSCTPGVGYAAQSPDGRGMVCGDNGWVPGP